MIRSLQRWKIWMGFSFSHNIRFTRIVDFCVYTDFSYWLLAVVDKGLITPKLSQWNVSSVCHAVVNKCNACHRNNHFDIATDWILFGKINTIDETNKPPVPSKDYATCLGPQERTLPPLPLPLPSQTKKKRKNESAKLLHKCVQSKLQKQTQHLTGTSRWGHRAKSALGERGKLETHHAMCKKLICPNTEKRDGLECSSWHLMANTLSIPMWIA